MRAYEAGTPAYFATPPVNLIRAYHASLKQILNSNVSLQERFQLHREAAQRIRQAALDLGLKLVPTDSYYTANGLSAVSGLSLLSCVERMLNSGWIDLLPRRTWRSGSRAPYVQEADRHHRWHSQGQQRSVRMIVCQIMRF
jgi:hypothetical protein